MIFKEFSTWIIIFFHLLSFLPESRLITGGYHANITNFPHHAYIYIFNFYTQLSDHYYYKRCGGVLIRPKWIITSAHCCCTQDQDDMIFKIRLGIDDISQYGIVTESKNYYCHPKYSSNPNNDICLVETSDIVPINHKIRPALLPIKDEDKQFIDKELYSTGFGITTYESKEDDIHETFKLKALKLKMLPAGNKCMPDVTTSENENNETDLICASNLSGGSPCLGDEGGGLVGRKHNDHFVILGLNSINNCKNQSGYTRVSVNLNWINEIIDGKASVVTTLKPSS